jgi:hypothetical protein
MFSPFSTTDVSQGVVDKNGVDRRLFSFLVVVVMGEKASVIFVRICVLDTVIEGALIFTEVVH